MTAEEKREQHRLYTKDWRERNRDRYNAYYREYYRNHREEQLRRNADWMRKHRLQLKIDKAIALLKEQGYTIIKEA